MTIRARAARYRKSTLWVALLCALLGPGTGCGQNAHDSRDDLGRDPALEARVSELLPRVASLAGLAAVRVPGVRRASAATLESYLLERLESEYPGAEVENMARAYRAFGLLPDTVDLRQLLVDLLLEQTVGYYDPGRDLLFIREGLAGMTLDVVLVHELVHALQDQRIDLDSLLDSRESNDARTAIQAAIEGHATAVMFAYLASRAQGQDIGVENLPDLSLGAMAASAAALTQPRLAKAPAVIRESLLFSYFGGARFVQRLWRARTEKPVPFGTWLPASTEQLLHTERILEERDAPSRVEIGEPEEGWTVTHGRDLGELEIAIYFEEHLDDEARASRAAAGWDGDAYVLLSRDEDEALVWYTAWDSAADAHEFADAYRAGFAARFGPIEEAEGVGVAAGADELLGRARRARLDLRTVAGKSVVGVVETAVDSEFDQAPGVVVLPDAGAS